MTCDFPEGMRISKAAFALADAGRLEEAAERYAEAVRSLPADHYWSPNNHQEFASVLRQLGRNAEALEHYQIALEQQALYQDEGASPVVMARYWLAEHLLAMAEPERALDVVAPSLRTGSPTNALSHMLEAEALAQLGRSAGARNAAELAVATSESDGQRDRIRERLRSLL